MKLPLSLTVAGPSARKHAPALAAAAGLVALQVGVSLLAPWPLALAIDYALGGKKVKRTAVMNRGESGWRRKSWDRGS